MKKCELRRLILSQFDSLTQFAEKIGSSKTAVSLEICGHKDMRASRIELYAKTLGIEQSEIGRLFFPDMANNAHIRLHEALNTTSAK